jgi:hypothetical protein
MHKSFAHIGEFLNQCNFKGSDHFFHRVAGSHVILVRLEGSADGDGFTVSYGLHPILPGVKKIHHRDYLFKNCNFKGQVLNSRKTPVWNYHLDTVALSTLTSRLLAGISTLETRFQQKN